MASLLATVLVLLLIEAPVPMSASGSCGTNRYQAVGNTNPDTNTSVNTNRCQGSYGVYCCFCPGGSYAPNGVNVNAESDCVPCPKGSFNSDTTFSTSYGSCVLCPVGKYGATTGATSCTSCPAGDVTFTSNYLQGPSFNQQVGAITPESCVPNPVGYLTLSYTTYYTTYDSSGYNTGGTTTVAYPSACNAFGKIVPASAVPVNGVYSASQCQVCAYPSDKFLAGGFTSLNSLSICPPSSSCFTQYLYGQEVDKTSKQQSDGSFYSTREFTAADATCVSSCPAGTGNVVVGEVKSCSTCKMLLGQYSNGEGTCLRCDTHHFPASDGAAGCQRCPYPFTSRWNTNAADSQSYAPTDQYALQNYAQNVLQYRSCQNHDSQDTSLCLCLQLPAVLAVCGSSALFFFINMLVFVCCTVGRHPGKAVSEGMIAVEMQQTEPAPGNPGNPATPATTPGKAHEQLPGLASESQDSAKKNLSLDSNENDPDFLTWTPVKPDEDLPPLKKPELVGWRVTIGILAYVLVPFVDNLTDLAFIISNPFFSVSLFIAMVICFCLPGLFYFKTLVDKRAVPKFYIFPMPDCLIFQKYDSLYKSIVGFVVILPFLLLNSPFLMPWLLVGSLLYSSKAFAVRPISNLWLHLWTGDYFALPGTKGWERRQKDLEYAEFHPIDERVLNESIYSHILGETFPILIIQFLNNTFSDSWTPLAIFSMAFSIFNSMSGIYRIAYYKLYLKVPLVSIPVDFTVMGVSFFGKEIEKKIMGDSDVGESSAEVHRLSLTRTISGRRTSAVDEWVDSDGHQHHETVKTPVLTHVVEDLLLLKGRIELIEDKIVDILRKIGGNSNKSSPSKSSPSKSATPLN